METHDEPSWYCDGRHFQCLLWYNYEVVEHEIFEGSRNYSQPSMWGEGDQQKSSKEVGGGVDGESLDHKLDDPQYRWLHEDLVARVAKGSASGSHVFATNVGRERVVVCKVQPPIVARQLPSTTTCLQAQRPLPWQQVHEAYMIAWSFYSATIGEASLKLHVCIFIL